MKVIICERASARATKAGELPRRPLPAQEHTCCDPKGGELCLTRAKPEETLVEARSRSDVQIDGQSWV